MHHEGQLWAFLLDLRLTFLLFLGLGWALAVLCCHFCFSGWRNTTFWMFNSNMAVIFEVGCVSFGVCATKVLEDFPQTYESDQPKWGRDRHPISSGLWAVQGGHDRTAFNHEWSFRLSGSEVFHMTWGKTVKAVNEISKWRPIWHQDQISLYWERSFGGIFWLNKYFKDAMNAHWNNKRLDTP